VERAETIDTSCNVQAPLSKGERNRGAFRSENGGMERESAVLIIGKDRKVIKKRKVPQGSGKEGGGREKSLNTKRTNRRSKRGAYASRKSTIRCRRRG